MEPSFAFTHLILQLSKVEASKFACIKNARERSAPSKETDDPEIDDRLVFSKLAPEKSAKETAAPVRDAPERLAFLKIDFSTQTPSKMDPPRSLPEKSMPLRSAPEKSLSVRLSFFSIRSNMTDRKALPANFDRSLLSWLTVTAKPFPMSSFFFNLEKSSSDIGSGKFVSDNRSGRGVSTLVLAKASSY